jgi:hypothetical protein
MAQSSISPGKPRTRASSAPSLLRHRAPGRGGDGGDSVTAELRTPTFRARSAPNNRDRGREAESMSKRRASHRWLAYRRTYEHGPGRVLLSCREGGRRARQTKPAPPCGERGVNLGDGQRNDGAPREEGAPSGREAFQCGLASRSGESPTTVPPPWGVVCFALVTVADFWPKSRERPPSSAPDKNAFAQTRIPKPNERASRHSLGVTNQWVVVRPGKRSRGWADSPPRREAG